MKIRQTNIDVQITKRKWYQIYKRGWHKHTNFWSQRCWVRFKWSKEDDLI